MILSLNNCNNLLEILLADWPSSGEAPILTNDPKTFNCGTCEKCTKINKLLEYEGKENEAPIVNKDVQGRFKLEFLSGGVTNVMLKVTNTENGNWPIMALRLFGEHSEKYIDRKREKKMQEHLSKFGIGKKYVYRFESTNHELSGVVEEYLSGKELSVEELRGEKSLLIAKCMAELHCIPLPEGPDLGGDIKQMAQKVDFHLQQSREWLKKCVEMQQQEHDVQLFNFDYIFNTITTLEVMMRLDSGTIPDRLRAIIPDYCIVHGDLLAGNVIYHEGRVSLIDFEYMTIGFPWYDIGNTFNETVGYESSLKNYEEYYPLEAYRQKFIREYVATMAKSKNITVDVLEDDMRIIEQKVAISSIISHFYWGSWSLYKGCLHCPGEIDFKTYGYQRLSAAVSEFFWSKALSKKQSDLVLSRSGTSMEELDGMLGNFSGMGKL